MDNKQVTAEWIDQQRQISEIVNMTYEDAPGSVVPLLKQLEKSQTAALDALEASMAREAEKDATIARLKLELSAQKVAYQKLYGNHQQGISSKVIACPSCGGVDDIILHQRMDAPELFGLSCGECGGHATIQLFADPDEIARLTAERDAEKRRADAAEHKIYEIAHSGLCSACEQDFEVCQGADDYDDCRDGCPFVNLFLCGEVTGAIEPDGPCAENAPEGGNGDG